MPIRSLVKYWLPVLIWLAVVFVGSSDLMSAEHTSRFIGPFLRWFAPDIPDATIASVQLFVRKCAHLTEYAVLAALLYRAFRQNIARSWRAAIFAFFVTAACASLDEFHQAFVASRTGAPLDVGVDCCGAVIGLAVCGWFSERAPHRNGARSSQDSDKWPGHARATLRRYFEKRSAPRTIVSLLLIFAGFFGFLVSYVSLHLGLTQMWVRYPVALLAGYAFFIGLLRLWVELERARFNPQGAEVRALVDEERQAAPSLLRHDRRTSWLDCLDVTNVLDFDDGCLPALLALLVVGLVVVLVMALAAMPALLAEVFLDVFIVSVFYRRLRTAAREHWLGTAVRKTWWLALIAAALLSLAGWGLETLSPGSNSIGPAIQRILHGQSLGTRNQPSDRIRSRNLTILDIG
jgi:VanZ family protein